MELPTTSDALKIDRASLPSESQNLASEKSAEDEDTVFRTHRRFDRAARLFSEPGLHRLMGSRVMVIGVGGVGSFSAEALARSAVGTIALVDFDRVCVTNTNRQLHALRGTIGQRKVDAMAERLRLIHPTGRTEAIPHFYNAENRDQILDGKIDFVIDAIDNLSAKADLLVTCMKRGIPVVSSMGASGRMDPTMIQVTDLSETYKDAFASALRKILRQEHGLTFGKGKPLGISAVFSPEEVMAPSVPSYDQGVGFRCICPGGQNGLHDCDRRARIDGTASFVTGSFGLVAASVVVKTLISKEVAAADRTKVAHR